MQRGESDGEDPQFQIICLPALFLLLLHTLQLREFPRRSQLHLSQSLVWAAAPLLASSNFAHYH